MHRKKYIFMRYNWILFCFYLIFTTTYSQNIPKNSNKLDSQGRRQGSWTILFDASFHEVKTADQAEYYRIITYKDDIPVGRVTDYYLNGKKQWEGGFIQDRPTEIPHGIITFYYRNGNLQESYTYEKGKLNGPYSTYDSLGNKTLDGNYLNDSLQGQVTFFFSNGNISGIHNYSHGKREGQSRTYYPNGKKKVDTYYKNNRRQGIWIWYDENGQEIDRAEYDNGKQVGSLNKEVTTRFPVEMNIQTEPARNIQSIEFHPEGKFYSVTAEDYSIQIRESGNDLIIRTLTGHNSEIIHSQLIDNGKKLISVEKNGVFLMFNTETGNIEKRLDTHIKDILNFVYIEFEGSSESVLYVFSRSLGAILYTNFQGNYEADPANINFASYLASDINGSYYAAVMETNKEYGKLKKGDKFGIIVTLTADDTVKGRGIADIQPGSKLIRLCPVNNLIAFAGKQYVEIWNFVENKKILYWTPVKDEFDSTAYVQDLDFSSDGKYIAFSIGGKVVIVDIPKVEVYTKLINFDDNPRAVAFQPGTQRLLFSAGTSTYSFTINDDGWYTVEQISVEKPEYVCFTQSGKEMLQFSKYGITQWDMAKAKSAFWLYPNVDYSKEWVNIYSGAVAQAADFAVLASDEKIIITNTNPLTVDAMKTKGFQGEAIGVHPKTTSDVLLIGSYIKDKNAKEIPIYARIYDVVKDTLKTEKLLFKIPETAILKKISNLTFTANGEFFTCTYGDGILATIRYADLKVQRSNTVSALATVYANQSISPDGKWLVYPTNEGNNAWIAESISGGKKVKFIENADKAVLSWMSDASKLLIATPNGRLFVFNPQNWTKPDTLNTVTFARGIVSLDNRYFSVYSEYTGKIEYWDIQQDKPLLTFLQFGKGDRVRHSAFYTPDNHYYGSTKALQNMHFTMGLSTFDIGQFDLQYNRPDIIVERLPLGDQNLKNSYKRIWQKRIRKLGFSEQTFGLKSFESPLIAFDNVNRMLTSDKDTFKLFVEYSDEKYLLDRVHVRVNNVPMFGKAGLSLSAFAVADWADNFYIPLSPGKNKIEVSVVNEIGVESPARSLTITKDDTTHKKPNLYIFAVGVSKYSDSRMNLTYAAKDAQDVANLFGKNLNKEYDSVKVQIITNEKATRSAILAIRKQLENTKITDHVIFFYAGHGVLDDSLDYFLATTDIDFRNPKAKALKYDDLDKLLDGIPARQKLVLIDACHSGEIDKEDVTLATAQNVETGKVKFRSTPGMQVSHIGLENSIELMQELFTDLRKGNGATVISSAGGAEYAMESKEWNNGVFTYSLLRGLQDNSADLNQNGNITIEELQKYLQEKVTELTQGKQKPTSRIVNLENNFRVW